MTGPEIERMRERLARAVSTGVLPRALAPAAAGNVSLMAPDRVARFTAALEALTGTVSRAQDERAAVGLTVGLLAAAGARRIAAWDEAAIGLPGLFDALRAAGLDVVSAVVPPNGPSRAATLGALASCDAGLTGAAYGCASTGSLVLVHGPGRGRSASLLPPRHVAVLREADLRDTLAEVIDEAPAGLASSANVVAVTGPSRTADIEMTLTRGVHGPRHVDVVLVAAP